MANVFQRFGTAVKYVVLGNTDVAATMLASYLNETPVYQEFNLENAIRYGYKKNEIIYACIGLKADSAATPRLLVREVGGGKELHDHPLRNLIRQPNKFMTEYDFFAITLIYLDLAGNSYWEKVRNKAGKIVELWPLRPDWLSPIRSQKEFISGYKYAPPGLTPVEIRTNDVLDFKLYDPMNFYKGLSPVRIASRMGDVDNSVTDYVKLFFQKGGMPPGLIVSRQKLIDVQVEDIRRRWRERYGGFENWIDPAVLDSDAQFQRIGLTFEEMGFEKLDARSEARICMCCVPDTLVVTQRGLVPIQDIEVGTKVLTHRGRWRKVTKVIQNPIYAPLVEISAQNRDVLRVTNNHPIYASLYHVDERHRQGYIETRWVDAGKLVYKKGNKKRFDYDALTIPQIEFGSGELHLGEYVLGRGHSSVWEEEGYLRHSMPHAKVLPSTIVMNRQLGRLLGFIMSEGHVGKDLITMSFHRDEIEYQNEVVQSIQDLFGLEARISTAAVPTVRDVHVRSAMLTELFSCENANRKQLPQWAWNGTKEFFEGVLSAWLDGDGSHIDPEKSNNIRGNTASKNLAWQMYLIAIALGKKARLGEWTQRDSYIDGRLIPGGNKMYSVSWNETENPTTFRIDGGAHTSPIRSVSEYAYGGDYVYNLEVEEDESYVTTSGAVHNCLRVPPIMVGATVGLRHGTYSNYEQARKAFWEDTLAPQYKRIADKLNIDLVPEFGKGIELRWDYSAVPALQEDINSRWTRATKAFVVGAITVNQFQLEVGYERMKDGDYFVRPLNTIEVPITNVRPIAPPKETIREAGPIGAPEPPSEATPANPNEGPLKEPAVGAPTGVID